MRTRSWRQDQSSTWVRVPYGSKFMGWEMGGNKFASIYKPILNLLTKVLNLILECMMLWVNGGMLSEKHGDT